ncbi:Armadillo repeat-containing protein [Arachis hypogaea]|nr:Armadillo repeat-containing protein [Arachis hypogaea]
MIFTIEQRQRERTGKYGSPRFQYLQELVTQFQNTTDEARVVQFVTSVLPNLIHEQLNVLELFLDCMTEPNEKLVEFGVGGICNCCAVILGEARIRDLYAEREDKCHLSYRSLAIYLIVRVEILKGKEKKEMP